MTIGAPPILLNLSQKWALWLPARRIAVEFRIFPLDIGSIACVPSISSPPPVVDRSNIPPKLALVRAVFFYVNNPFSFSLLTDRLGVRRTSSQKSAAKSCRGRQRPICRGWHEPCFGQTLPTLGAQRKKWHSPKRPWLSSAPKLSHGYPRARKIRHHRRSGVRRRYRRVLRPQNNCGGVFRCRMQPFPFDVCCMEIDVMHGWGIVAWAPANFRSSVCLTMLTVFMHCCGTRDVRKPKVLFIHRAVANVRAYFTAP